MPPIYVAVPVYNGADTIAETLKNILDQSYSEFRVLVYDDGSTDDTAEIVERTAARDARVSLLRGRRNRGRGHARNELLRAAEDGLIAWQDADDLWSPRKLEVQLSAYRGERTEWRREGPGHFIVI